MDVGHGFKRDLTDFGLHISLVIELWQCTSSSFAPERVEEVPLLVRSTSALA